MVVTSIIWDIYATGTYSCEFVTAYNGTTVLYSVNSSFVPPGSTSYTIVPTAGDFFMPAGLYYPSLASGSLRRWYNSNTVVADSNYIQYQSCWNLGGLSNDTCGMRLVGFAIDIRGANSITKYIP
jgi:hypothetical protein